MANWFEVRAGTITEAAARAYFGRPTIRSHTAGLNLGLIIFGCEYMPDHGYGRDSIAFWVVQTEHPVPADEKSSLHFCFIAANSAAVDAFHAAALRSGALGGDNGAPGLRPNTAPSTMPPSSLTRTDTGSRRITVQARPEVSQDGNAPPPIELRTRSLRSLL